MANQSLSNVGGLMKNTTTRVVIFLTFGAIIGAVIYSNATTSNQAARPKELQAAVGAPSMPTASATPGTSDNQLHNEKIRELNRTNAAEAANSGNSATPRLSNQTGDREKDPFDLTQKKPDGGKPADPNVPMPVAAKPVVQAPTPVAAQQVQAPLPKSPQLISTEASMAAAMGSLLNSWTPAPQRMEVEYVGGKNPSASQVATSGSVAPAASSGGAVVGQGGPAAPDSGVAQPSQQKKVAIKAGSILHAVIITAINSDEPGPILAEITSGPYRGGRLIGKFEVAKDSEKMALTFSTLSMQNAEKSYEFTAYAVDPETARTAIASNVDHHYLSRYGAFIGAQFLKGYSTALSQQGTTQTISAGLGGVAATTTYPKMNNKDLAISALGSVGGEVAGTLKEGFRRPPTVTLNPGAEIGLLVTKDTTF